MPRAKTLSSLIQTAAQSTVNQVKANPSHISLFCSEKQADSLLNPLPDVKPIQDLDKLPKLKVKIIKTHLKMEASARDAFKLGLAGNMIRSQEKFVVVNSMLFQKDESDNAKKQAVQVVEKLKNNYSKYPEVQQKLTTSIKTFGLQSITSPPALNNKWILDDTSPSSAQILTYPYKLLINPTILYGSLPTTEYQQCISFPFMQFMIPRYNRLLIHYYNENYNSQFAFLKGFVARVIQHEVDHLEGRTVVDWRVNHGVMTMNQSVLQYFPKASAVVEDYAKTLRDVLKDFPQIVEVNEEYVMEEKKIDKLLTEILKVNSSLPIKQDKEQMQPINASLSYGRSATRSIDKKLHQQQTYNSRFSINKQLVQQQLPFQDDYVLRIVRHFKKEFVKFDQKIQLGLINTQYINQSKQSTIEAREAELKVYNEEQYSRLIKVRYLNLQQAGIQEKLSKSQNKMIKKQRRQQGNFQLSDEEVEKLEAKLKKSNKKRR